MQDISGEGYSFDFITNEVTGIEVNDFYAIVDTYEEFFFTDAEGEEFYYERMKEYYIVIEDDGEFKISDITIYD